MSIDFEVDRIMKLFKTNKEKKLELIRTHIKNNYKKKIEIRTVEDLYEYLIISEEEEISEVFELLDQNFAQGDPYFIFEFKLFDGKTQTELKTSIETALELNKEIKYNKDEDNFVFLKRVSDIDSKINDYLRFDVRYEKYGERRISLTEVTKGALEIKTTFEVCFDFKNSLCYFKCGDTNQLSCASKVIRQNVIGMFQTFESFNLFRKMQKFTQFIGEIDQDKQTVIILDFLENGLKTSNYLITDYYTISFSNAKSEKIRSVRISGSNLLESPEFAERIRFSDRIRSVKFRFYYEIRQSNGVLATIRINFPGTLKIVFSDMSNNNFQRDFLNHIYSRLNASIKKTYEGNKLMASFQNLIRIVEAKDSIYAQNVLSEIVSKIKSEVENSNDRNRILKIINTYLR